MRKMRIKARWVGGSDETHIGAVDYPVSIDMSVSIGAAVAEHILALRSTHNEFYLENVSLEITFPQSE